MIFFDLFVLAFTSYFILADENFIFISKRAEIININNAHFIAQNKIIYISLSFQVVLETEITNKPALRLYENLGFVRDKRLFRYYLNGVDALRLKLWLR